MVELVLATSLRHVVLTVIVVVMFLGFLLTLIAGFFQR